MQTPFPSTLAALGLSAVLAGCAVAPAYVRPASPVPASATGYTAGAAPATTASAAVPLGQAQQWVEGPVPAQWWRGFGSPALDALVDEALRASPTLAAAEAVLSQARELYAAQAGTTQRPQVDLALGAQRQQISPSAQGLPGDTREFGLYNALSLIHI